MRISGNEPSANPQWSLAKQSDFKRTEGCSKLKSPETRQVQETLVSTLEQAKAKRDGIINQQNYNFSQF